MKGINHLFPFLFILLLFLSCKDEPELDNDLLMGTIRVWDHNVPFPFFLDRTEESLQLINYKNELIDSTTSLREYVSMDTIKMQDHQFLVLKTSPHLLLFDIKDSLRFPHQNPIHSAQFVKTEKSQDIDFSSVLQNLRENKFQTEVESAHFATPNRDLEVVKTMNFSEDSLQTTYSYYYNNDLIYAEKEKTRVHIFERKGKVFFSKEQDAENPEILFQISGGDDKSIVLRTFNYNEEIIESLEIVEDFSNSKMIHTFDRCLEGQPGEYYHDNLTYTKGNEYLIEKISEAAPKASGDGYITVHFTINCKGQMGHPGLEQMDTEFRSASFDPKLVQHIITQVMDLKDWPEIKSGVFYKDIHSFLMFRIKNGKISDLCP